MGGRVRISLAGALAATALALTAPAAGADTPLRPNTDWSSLLPPAPVTPAEPQPGPVENCRRPSIGCVDRVVGRLRRLRDSLACDHRGVFATTYLELTKVFRDTLAGEPELFQFHDYLYTQDALFANVYFDAFERWEGGLAVAPAWRIAFEQAARGRITGAQEMLLGINAHVQNDMPFVVAALGIRTPEGASRKPDHDAVNEVLNRAYENVVREVGRRYDPTMDLTNPDAVTADDIGGLEMARGWREGVWRNAERLLTARSEIERRQIALQIEANAAVWARGIAAAQTPGIRAVRDRYCAAR
jgi:hypothetical protein